LYTAPWCAGKLDRAERRFNGVLLAVTSELMGFRPDLFVRLLAGNFRLWFVLRP